MQNKKINIFITGGTIDSQWDGKLDTAVINKKSSLPDYFESLILYADVEFTEICLKDSRSLNSADLSNLLKNIEESPCTKIIITHGTYTMPDTAKFLSANLIRKDQTVILTGSMVPLSGFLPSDAPFNLGYAIAQVDNLQPGVYLCMNGKTFTPDEVAKNLAEGKFYSVFERKQ